jgi:hypothetical protein
MVVLTPTKRTVCVPEYTFEPAARRIIQVVGQKKAGVDFLLTLFFIAVYSVIIYILKVHLPALYVDEGNGRKYRGLGRFR